MGNSYISHQLTITKPFPPTMDTHSWKQVLPFYAIKGQSHTCAVHCCVFSTQSCSLSVCWMNVCKIPTSEIKTSETRSLLKQVDIHRGSIVGLIQAAFSEVHTLPLTYTSSSKSWVYGQNCHEPVRDSLKVRYFRACGFSFYILIF